jgi:pimeloyl-ACP methyl ester carboxylesterase
VEPRRPDWGAETAPIAAVAAPERFRRLVSIAYAPAFLLRQFSSLSGVLAGGPLLARQRARNWYMYFQLLPLLSEASLRRLIPFLWSRWSPGYDAHEDVEHVSAALAPPGHATAALRYYRALYLPWMRSREYAREQSHLFDVPAVPLLYLQGDRDGCLLPALAARAAAALPPGCQFELVRGAGHWLHLENRSTSTSGSPSSWRPVRLPRSLWRGSGAEHSLATRLREPVT